MSETIDLKWIGTTLIAMQIDMRTIKNDVAGLKEDNSIIVDTLRRLERKQASTLDELRALYPLITRLHERMDAIERTTERAI
jgi:flagellar biosynthesis/type III secretory pathway chaperone